MNRLMKQLEAKKAQLAKLRDALREIEFDAASHADRCDDAIESLRDAIDTLSELL